MAFSSLLKQDSPNGYTRWPIQASLHPLAQKDLLMDSQNLTRVENHSLCKHYQTNLTCKLLLAVRNINKNIPEDPAFLLLWNTTSIIDQPIPRHAPISPTTTTLIHGHLLGRSSPGTSQELTLHGDTKLERVAVMAIAVSQPFLRTCWDGSKKITPIHWKTYSG